MTAIDHRHRTSVSVVDYNKSRQYKRYEPTRNDHQTIVKRSFTSGLAHHHWLITFNSVLLFCAFPSSDSLLAIGWSAPKPRNERRLISIPLVTIYFTTDCARSFDSFRLSAGFPTLSVCPLIWIFKVGFSFNNMTTLSSSEVD